MSRPPPRCGAGTWPRAGRPRLGILPLDPRTTFPARDIQHPILQPWRVALQPGDGPPRVLLSWKKHSQLRATATREDGETATPPRPQYVSEQPPGSIAEPSRAPGAFLALVPNQSLSRHSRAIP